MKTLHTQNNSLGICLWNEEEETRATIKETIRRIQSWSWNRSFIGLTSWTEKSDVSFHTS